MSAPIVPLVRVTVLWVVLLAPWEGTSQASVKGRHLTPTSIEWLHLDGADVIIDIHSWSLLPVLGQVI